MFARSLRVVIAGVSSLTVARRPNAARGKHTSAPHKGDKALRSAPDPQQLADQRAKHDVNKLLDRYGVVS